MSNPPVSQAMDVPKLYADAAQIHVQPFSVHLLLGTIDLDGQPNPQLQVTMSPEFAIHLKNALIEALHPFDDRDSKEASSG